MRTLGGIEVPKRRDGPSLLPGPLHDGIGALVSLSGELGLRILYSFTTHDAIVIVDHEDPVLAQHGDSLGLVSE